MKENKTGDMPGDRIQIGESHIKRADIIYPYVREAREKSGKDKFVVSVYGGSGVGKSEIGSLLAGHFEDDGIPAYVMSGDNYPYRIPEGNDMERINRFRYGGLKAISQTDGFCSQWSENLRSLWENGRDADPRLTGDYPFLETYQKAGREALEKYLSTGKEIDFDLVNSLINRFKNGEASIALKRMGRSPEEMYFEPVDFSRTAVLIMEWTHGNNEALRGVDYPVFLFSTPEETLEHRMSRGRDSAADSPFISLVLKIEQDRLNRQAETASLIVSKSGEILTLKEMRGEIS